jgi:hypothetical protein
MVRTRSGQARAYFSNPTYIVEPSESDFGGRGRLWRETGATNSDFGPNF